MPEREIYIFYILTLHLRAIFFRFNQVSVSTYHEKYVTPSVSNRFSFSGFIPIHDYNLLFFLHVKR